MLNKLLSHEARKPFVISNKSPITFSVASQIPLVGQFARKKWKKLILARRYKNFLHTTKTAAAELFAAFLGLAATARAGGSPFLAFTHNVIML